MKQQLLILLITLPFISFSQRNITFNNDTMRVYHKQGIDLGFNTGKYFFGELGYFQTFFLDHKDQFYGRLTIYTGSEIKTGASKVYGPKLAFKYYLLACNVNLANIYYTDFKGNGSYVLRPEIGIGLFPFDINYGYNFNFSKNLTLPINSHMLSFRIYPTLKNKREPIPHQYRQNEFEF